MKSSNKPQGNLTRVRSLSLFGNLTAIRAFKYQILIFCEHLPTIIRRTEYLTNVKIGKVRQAPNPRQVPRQVSLTFSPASSILSSG